MVDEGENLEFSHSSMVAEVLEFTNFRAIRIASENELPSHSIIWRGMEFEIKDNQLLIFNIISKLYE